MMDLFNEKGAIFSPCRQYRYMLWRYWDRAKPTVVFIGLNPSTANEVKPDPTITRVVGMAANLGYGGVLMMNLFALVSSNPKDLLTCDDPIGENDNYLNDDIVHDIIFAWGTFKEAKERAEKIIARFPKAKALVINKDGSPRHPLYVPTNTVPISFAAK